MPYIHCSFLPVLQDPEAFEREYALHSHPVEAASAKAAKKPKKIADSGSEDENSLEDDQFTTVGKGGKAMQFTADAIFKTLKIVHEARGKKVRGVWLLFTSLLMITLEYGPRRTDAHSREAARGRCYPIPTHPCPFGARFFAV